MQYNEFLSRCVKIGIITLTFAAVANFIPAIYLWLAYGVIPPMAEIWKLVIILASINGVSWFAQPISYFPVLGTSGTYITWLAGSGADIRTPVSAIAQKSAGVEQGTPEGNVISTIAIATSVFVTFTVITVFTFTGTYILSVLPKFVTSSFVYILPAIFAAVVVSFAQKNIDLCLFIVAFTYSFMWLNKVVFSLPAWFATLFTIIMGMIFGYLKYKHNKKQSLNSSKS